VFFGLGSWGGLVKSNACIKRKRILFIGPYLPSLGGVVIHIQRAASLLNEKYVVDVFDIQSRCDPITVCGDVTVYRFRNLSKKCGRLIRNMMFRKYDIIHFQMSAFKKSYYMLPLLHIIKLFTNKLILTLHSGTLEYDPRMNDRFSRAYLKHHTHLERGHKSLNLNTNANNSVE